MTTRKRAERTKRDFRCPICRSTILLLNQPNIPEQKWGLLLLFRLYYVNEGSAWERGVGRKKKGSHFASLSFSPSPSSGCRVTFPQPIPDRVEIIRESDSDSRSKESFLRLLILHFTLSLHFASGLQSAFYTDRLNNIS